LVNPDCYPIIQIGCVHITDGGSNGEKMQDHHRRSIRLQQYDYSQTGFYFITICTHNRFCLFGAIDNDTVRYSKQGKIAVACWSAIPDHFFHVELDEFIVMPNHVHGILRIVDNNDAACWGTGWGTGWGTACRARTTMAAGEKFGIPVAGSIPTVIRSFKSAVTKGIHDMSQLSAKNVVWQRNYWEHLIRDEPALHRIRKYIINNPVHWATDGKNNGNTLYGHGMPCPNQPEPQPEPEPQPARAVAP
jgi:putative transposase